MSLIFASPKGGSSSGGSGDMLKSTYDTDNDGIVEQADVITNQGALATLNTVGTAQIENGAITNSKIDNGAIGYSNLAGSVQSSLDLADSALQNVVEDTTPQLGGTLDTNAKWISNGGTAGTGFFVGSTGTGTFTAPSNANYSNVNSGNNAAGFQFAAEANTDNHRWRFYAATNGALIAYDVGNAATRFLIDSTGKGRFYNDLQVDGDLVVDTDTLTTDIATGRVGIGTTSPSEKLDVAGNIAVSGTVDGRDIAADGTKLDGIEAGATADQNASEVPVSATPTNYTAASANVEAHLAGIDTALASIGGGGGVSNVVLAQSSSSQSLTNLVITKVLFSTENLDQNGDFSSSTYTCASDGVYRVFANLSWSGMYANKTINLYIYKNGSSVLLKRDVSPNLTANWVNDIDAALNLSSGDTIEIYAQTNTGATTSLRANDTFLNIYKIS